MIEGVEQNSCPYANFTGHLTNICKESILAVIVGYNESQPDRCFVVALDTAFIDKRMKNNEYFCHSSVNNIILAVNKMDSGQSVERTKIFFIIDYAYLSIGRCCVKISKQRLPLYCHMPE